MKNFQITDLDTGKKYWISRSIAVHGILLVNDKKQNQKFLLIEKRGPGCPDEIGKWADPTGYVDWDETLKEALYREIWEELGLDLKTLQEVDISLHGIYDTPKGKQNITIRYQVDLDYEEIKPLLKEGIINSDTYSRGGEKDEISGVNLMRIYPRRGLVSPEFFAFNHGEIINDLIKYYNNL